MRVVRASVLLLWSGVLGCGEDPAFVQVVGQDATGWGVVDEPRGTLEDLDAVRGAGLEITTGGRVSDAELTELPRDGGLDADRFLTGARTPRTAWMPVGGTAVPTDYDTLALFTAYVRVDQALAFYRTLGVRDEAVADLTVHFDMRGSPAAAYHLGADALLLARPGSVEDIPASLNHGIIVHEVGHRMVYWELWDGRMFASLDGTALTVPKAGAFILTGAVDEGLADYFAAAATDDPNTVGASYGEELVSRDLSVPKLVDPALTTPTMDQLTGDEPYDPHILGAVLAACLWATGEEVGHDRVSAALLEVQRALSPQVRALEYGFGDLEVALVEAVGPEACEPFQTAYAPVGDLFSEVCP